MAEDRTRALLELLYHVSREVATALDLRTVLQRVLYQATQNVGGERGSIMVLDDNGKPVDATIVYGERFHEHTTQQLRDTVERGLAGWVVRNRKGVLIADTSKDDRWLRRPDDAIERTGSKSAICVPLLARERLVGVLTLVHPTANAFNEVHLDLMQAIADQAGIAVLNARLYTESQRQARVMSALAESAAAITTSLRLDEVLQRILNQTMQALQVETVALALANPASGELVFRAAAGQNAGNIIDKHVPAGEGLVGQVVKDGQGVTIPNASGDSRFKEVDKFGGIVTQAVAVVPIQSQGKVIGVLEAINPAAKLFDPEALMFMNGIGNLAGTAIQNAQLFERLGAAHERYREFFEDSIDPILITDWNGKILEINRRAISISGYTEMELQSMSIDQLHEVNWKITGTDFKNIRGFGTYSYESVLHRQDGLTVSINAYVRPIVYEDADVLQWTMHDISERKALDDLRNDLTAMVYHDLRSPLSNIISSLDILSSMVNTQDNEAIQSILMIASNSTARIERLISSLLDINRMEAGQQIVNQKTLNIDHLISEAVEDVLPTAKSRNQTMHSETEAGLPAVWADADIIRRVLINLIENAVKFTPVDGQIDIHTTVRDGWVQVAVHDNGPGIPPADQERIFGKFTRLRGKEKPGGLGIGLAFCRLAVTGHGGRIWIESKDSNGTTFFFTLPIATPEQIEANPID